MFLERRMTVEDVASVAALEREIFPDPWPEKSFRDEVTDRDVSWPVVLEDEDGQVAAYMVVWLVVDEIHLGNIAVAPARRRQGLARQLMELLERTGWERRARFISLEVRESNEAARALYEDLGFRTVQVLRAYYSDNKEDALVMMKRLYPDGDPTPLSGAGN